MEKARQPEDRIPPPRIKGGASAQLLRIVNFQLTVGSMNCHRYLSYTLMMCVKEGTIPTSPLKKGINTTNGIPKDVMCLSLSCWSYRQTLRRNYRTKGSSSSRQSQPILKKNGGNLTLNSTSANAKDAFGVKSRNKGEDGELVVPNNSSNPNHATKLDAHLGRGSGKLYKPKLDASCIGANQSKLPKLNKEASVADLIKKWKQVDIKSRPGLTVPRKFVKIVNICNTNKHCIVDNIYSLLYHRECYDLAYGQIKSNPGNMTPGPDGTTLDGWSMDKIDKIISKMKNESFKFTPARIVEIPKQDGSKRQLAIAPPKDKIVQRILAWILEAIYEPTFLKNNFGFRPNLGCHDAIKFIDLKYQGARWLIEGDISKCFDEIDHNILILILRRRIKDEKFLRLIRKALKAGYLDTWSFPKDSITGTPQGSILSPILCNIFMHQFDEFIVNHLQPKYTRGKTRRQPLEYKNTMSNSRYYSKKYDKSNNPRHLKLSQKYRKQAQKMPSVDSADPHFRRFTYCRYADDWLIGFAGPHTEALDIRESCKTFLESIKLRLNMEKTLVTKASTGCIFLGMKIHIPVKQQRFRTKGSRLVQRAVLGVRINAPIKLIFKKLSQAGYCTPSGNKSQPRMALYVCEKDEMTEAYNKVLRGYLNYYSPCDNYPKLAGTLFYTLRSSLCKILAAKYKLRTVRATLLKYGKYLQKSGKVSLLNFKDQKIRFPLYKTNGTSEPRLRTLFQKASYTIRGEALECVRCGSTYKVHMHHVRMIKDLIKHTDPISRAMIARKRKQIPLCQRCHVLQHVQLNRIRKGAQKE